MKYDFKGITCEDLSYKLNRVRIDPQQRLDIKPQFSRQVRKANDNPKLNFVALSVKVESTEAEPKPFNINVGIVGVFELAEEPDAQQEREFVIEATSLLYPYLRSMVTNLTAQAFISPLNLPIINGPIFPEDRDMYAFSVGDNN
jgi:preprotein translocase subunit SecB